MNSGINKHRLTDNGFFNKQAPSNLIYIGRVTSNDDEYDGGRLRVRIDGLDDSITDDKLPYAFPLIPKFFGVTPNVGEAVMIFKTNIDTDFENRMWVGPIISQPQFLKNDPYFFTATSTMDSGVVEPQTAPSNVTSARGVYPDKKYITIQGRNNNDIIFKDNELVIRNGKHIVDENLQFNDETISYIQLKNDVILDDDSDKVGSVTNIVSNRINLLSHDGIPSFNLADRDKLINDDQMKRILDNCSPLVYGDKLVTLLELIKEFISSHTHPYNGLPPVMDKNTLDILKTNLDDLLSKNIRIN